MLKFLHISDTHISADPDYHPAEVPDEVWHPNHGVQTLLNTVRQLPFEFDFILHTGDVCADPVAEHYQCARELLCQLEQPLYMLPGNHDSPEMMEAFLTDGDQIQVLGNELTTMDGCHLVTLDSNGPSDAHAPVIQEETIEKLASNLSQASGKPIVVAVHHPLIKTGVEWLDVVMRVKNGERVHSVLSQYANVIAGVFHGHIHQTTSVTSDGIAYTCCPSTWRNFAAYPGQQHDESDMETPAGFNLVMIGQARTFVRHFSLSAKA